MQDECAPDAERAAEEPGFEDHVVARRRLAGLGTQPVVVQSSWANTNAAKSTSWESSTSRSRVDRPG